jgi:hypothetical protein
MTRTIALLLAIATLAVLPVEAQETAQRGQGARGRAARGAALSVGEVVNMLDAYAILQAQDMLQLGETQYGQFVTRLKTLQETRRRNQQARHRIIQRLRELAGPQAPTGDESIVRTQLKALREHDDKSAAEIRRACDAIDEMLDARQQARFRLLEERLEARKIDLLMRARQGARQ